MARDTVSLEYVALIKGLREQLRSIPDITGAEARKTVSELKRTIKAADSSSAAVVKANQRASASFRGTAAASAGAAAGTQRVDVASQSLTDAERVLAARMVGTEAALRAKAKALGISLGQLRQIEAETKAVAQAEVLAASAARSVATATAHVTSSEKSSLKGVKALTKGMHQHSTALQNTLIQLPDIASGFAMGMPPMQMFVQQGLQVIQTSMVSFLTIGAKVVSFLSSPWGLAIAAALAAGSSLANELDRERDALSEFTRGIDDHNRSVRRLAVGLAATEVGTGNVESFIKGLDIQIALMTGDIDQADVQTEKLQQQLRSKLGPSLLVASKAVQENSNDIERWTSAVDSGKLSSVKLLKASKALEKARAISPKLQAEFEALKGQMDRAQSKIAKLRDVMIEANAPSKQLGHAARDLGDAERQAAEAAREFAAAQRASRAAMDEDTAAMLAGASAVEQLQELRQSATESRLSGLDAVDAAERRQIRRAEELLQSAVASAAPGSAGDQERIAAVSAAEEAKTEIHRAAAKQRVKISAAETRREAGLMIGASAQIVGAVADTADAVATTLETRHKAAARAVFAVGKAASVAGAVIDTAKAVAGVNAAWAWNPPVDAALTGAAVAVGAAQVATILAQGVSFHAGGIAGGVAQAPSLRRDEVPATLLRGEPVLTRAAGAALGAHGVAAINRGESPATTITVVQRYGHRLMDAATYDAASNPSSALHRAIRRRAGRAGSNRG